MTGMTIGTLAERAGVGVETVRFYEREGLIERPPRPRRGYRRYPPRTVTELRFIRRAQGLGFSLREIEDLLSLRLDPDARGADVRDRAEVKITEIEGKIRDLSRMRDVLMKLTAACAGDIPVADCPILDAMEPSDGDE